jgi:hypothetical protein
MEEMGDMLDSAMRWANVAHRREIGAPFLANPKNVSLRREGKRWLDGILRIKLCLASIEQCERED